MISALPRLALRRPRNMIIALAVGIALVLSALG